MENPYNAPNSNVAVNTPSVTKKSIWWKIYFFFISILSFLGMSSFLAADGAGIVDYLELMLLIIGTAGLFGFVFSKRILFPSFWIPFLIVYFLAGLFYESLSNVDMRQGMTDTVYYITIAFGYLISAPAYYGIYLYSKADKHPWTNT